jgi:transposase
MARYREIDQTNLILQVDLTRQLVAGTFEHAMAHIIDTKIDTTFFDEYFNNDETGAPAYDPKALLKVILYAYSKGILSSRKIEAACRENIIFMALSGDQRPDHSTIAAFVSQRCSPIRRIFTQVLMLCAQMCMPSNNLDRIPQFA